MFRMLFWALFMTVSSFGPTLAMNRLLACLENPAASIFKPYVWAAAMLLLPIVYSMFRQQYSVSSMALAANAKAALLQALFVKTLRVSIMGVPNMGKEVKGNRFGRINNLMSKDMYPFTANMTNGSDAVIANREAVMFSVSVPLIIIISTTLLIHLIGWSALVGFFCIAVTFPIQAFLYTRLTKLLKAITESSDERLGIIGELLNSVRVVKYFGWERVMMARIDGARDAEQALRCDIY